MTARPGPPPPPPAAPPGGGPPPGAPGPHLDDAALVRWLDGEVASEDGDPAAGARLAAHAGACAECRARADVLRARRARLGLLLAAADLPAAAPPADALARLLREADARRAASTGPAGADPAAGRRVVGQVRAPGPVRAAGRAADRGPPRPPAWAARRAARLAAACALLAAAGLSAQPVRQWVVAQWSRLTAPALPPTRPTGPAPTPVVTPSAAGAGPTTLTVTFAPEPGPFTVAFDARPAGGTLRVTADTLTAAAGGRVRATVTGAAGEELLVLPAGLRVRNRSTSTADYALVVPAGTGRVRVRFGATTTGGVGDTVITLRAAGAATVPLAAPRSPGPR